MGLSSSNRRFHEETDHLSELYLQLLANDPTAQFSEPQNNHLQACADCRNAYAAALERNRQIRPATARILQFRRKVREDGNG
jgi:predicted anti-sigma-YlaC factor YlaD